MVPMEIQVLALLIILLLLLCWVVLSIFFGLRRGATDLFKEVVVADIFNGRL